MKQEVTAINSGELFPFIVADNWYSPEEEKLIWKELDFYYRPDNLEPASDFSAKTKGVILSNSWRIYPDAMFTQKYKNVSSIMTAKKKFTYRPFLDFVKKAMPQGIQFATTNRDATMISYYDHAQEYKPHHDDPQFTILIWFYKSPKKFTGGDFIFTQPNVNVKCKHNRMVLFPSYYLHQVTPILMEQEHRNKGLGRFTITHFYWSHS
tara:strand:- start:547 stop:1170 length:624 start_codon:yes stop_codon:yes gene_type:complete